MWRFSHCQPTQFAQYIHVRVAVYGNLPSSVLRVRKTALCITPFLSRLDKTAIVVDEHAFRVRTRPLPRQLAIIGSVTTNERLTLVILQFGGILRQKSFFLPVARARTLQCALLQCRQMPHGRRRSRTLDAHHRRLSICCLEPMGVFLQLSSVCAYHKTVIIEHCAWTRAGFRVNGYEEEGEGQ